MRLPIFDLKEAPTIPDPNAIGNRQSAIENLLNRPAELRLREYKYRFSQSLVFGLPVVALQYWGRALGPVDSDRWVSLLQAVLAGWVLYVNLGMLFEGALLLRQRITSDFVVASIAALLYVASLISAVHGIVVSRLWYPLMFHVAVMVLATWTGLQWLRNARHRPD